MKSKVSDATLLNLPAEVQAVFEKSSSFLARKYDGTAPTPEELMIVYLSSAEPYEVVANLERQVLEVSGLSPMDHDEHLVQTYREMQDEWWIKGNDIVSRFW